MNCLNSFAELDRCLGLLNFQVNFRQEKLLLGNPFNIFKEHTVGIKRSVGNWG